MPLSDDAEMSSLASILDDVHHRLSVLTDRFAANKRDDVLAALLEAERQARAAAREIRRANRML